MNKTLVRTESIARDTQETLPESACSARKLTLRSFIKHRSIKETIMKSITQRISYGLILILLALPGAQAIAAGLLSPSSGNLPPLEIREHHVEVVLEDGYATTKVEQLFHNPHQQDLEAVYSFPLPEKGAVAEFTVWIDGKPINGEVLEKKQARELYEQEKSAGRDAGLTEQDGYKTFDISVTPVRAGQDTRIRLVYLQPVQVDTGIGRYVYPLEEGGVDEQKMAFWTANEQVKEHFSFNMKLRSGYPVEALRSPNQPQSVINKIDDQQWQLSINNQGQTASLLNDDESQAKQQMQAPVQNGVAAYTLDKDIVIYWRHAGDLPGSVDLVTYKPDPSKRGTFMLTITPGDDLKPITEGRDWAFVLDVSGSMKGGKLSSLTEGVEQALKAMSPDDRFRIVLFNNHARELTQGYTNATPEQLAHYSQQLAQLQANSGTNLYAGLKQGLVSLDADRTSSIVLVTDGVANVGETAQKKFMELIRKKDVRLFTFIMGNSANRPLLEAITRESGGFSASISNSDDIVGQLLLAASKVSHEALHGVKVDISGVKTSDITPKVIGSRYRGQQIILFGHYRGDGKAKVEVSGKISGKKKVYQTEFEFPAQTELNPELERLWAFASIEDLLQEMEDFGEKADMKQAVIDLAKEYSLVTDYTSMLVVGEEVFLKHGIERRNQKRLVIEQAAQQQRAQNPVQNHRVDTQKPMYKTKRADTRQRSSGGGFGGGAVGPWWLLLFVPAILLRRKGK